MSNQKVESFAKLKERLKDEMQDNHALREDLKKKHPDVFAKAEVQSHIDKYKQIGSY